MAELWKTFGHTAIKDILEKQLLSGGFPHAYLFTGPGGVGKKTLALELAQKILGSEELNRHPDFRLLAEPGQISVEQAREFIANLGFKPFLAKHKVAILDNAQNLNAQSSNALLKTLEEPASSTILILISSGKQLLPTIVSRCQVFNFNSFTTEQLLEFAGSVSLKTDEKTADLSFGSIARLMRLTKDESLRQELERGISRLDVLTKSAPSDRLLAIKEFSELENEDLERLLTDWFFWQASKLKQEPARYKILNALSEALRQLKTNKNRKLVLQGLFLKI